MKQECLKLLHHGLASEAICMNPYPCQAIIHRRKGHSIFQEMGYAVVSNPWSEVVWSQPIEDLADKPHSGN